MPSTACVVSAVTATFVSSWFWAAKPPITIVASAATKRMRVEMTNALLRSFEAISRSATSQTLVSSRGAGGTVPADEKGRAVLTG